MAMQRRSFVSAAAAATLVALVPVHSSAQTAQSAPNRAIFQVTDNDPARWNMILNNMTNLREGVGSEAVEIELVAYGPAILMLKGDSAVRQRIAEAVKSGVKVNACQNTMNAMKLAPSDMLGEIGHVPSGVVEVMRKQQQGWAYIRS